MRTEADYGIDAPKVLRNLLIVGVALLAAAWLFPTVRLGHVVFALGVSFVIPGVICIVEGLLMLLYVKVGKFKHRDRMLNSITWRGDETVLDVGTGRGLLLVGAAKRLTGGHAVGIDIWNRQDLSDNAIERTEQNLKLEGVADRCELQSVPAQAMPFADESFDVVLSNLCLHNIARREDRDQACSQIARVLKPGGLALISDFRNTGQYADAFRKAGLTARIERTFSLDTFPPLAVVRAEK